MLNKYFDSLSWGCCRGEVPWKVAGKATLLLFTLGDPYSSWQAAVSAALLGLWDLDALL